MPSFSKIYSVLNLALKTVMTVVQIATIMEMLGKTLVKERFICSNWTASTILHVIKLMLQVLDLMT